MQQWFTREKAQTDPNKGCRPSERPVKKILDKGIVLVDKPAGPPSNEVSSWIKKELNVTKSGHFGTLDPFATGVLPIGIGKGTKVSQVLSKTTKKYLVEVKAQREVSFQKFRDALAGFQGTNTQLPPQKSAVKRQERDREMYSQQLLDKKQNKYLFSVTVESGFYVRTMVEQLNEKLDCRIELENLRRTEQGSIQVHQCSKMQQIVDEHKFWSRDQASKIRQHVHPVEKAVQHLPKVVVKDSAVESCANGADLYSPGISKLTEDVKKDETCVILTLKGELVAIAESRNSAEKIYQEECTASSISTVFLDPDIYS